MNENNHMKRYSTLLEVKEMQIKQDTISHPIKQEKLIRQITPSIGEDLGKQ